MNQDLTNQEVNQLLCYLGDLYCRCYLKKDNYHNKSYVQCVDECLSLLEESQAMLLRKTYFEKTDKKWWVGFYSRTTYYRERSRAARAFLRCVM